MEELKLTIELVPEPLHYRSLKDLIPRKEWDKLRKPVYARYNYQCTICEAGGRMNCHEVWDYDDVNHVQRLMDLIPLCNMCHHCKHLGYAEILGSRRPGFIDTVIEHFCRVNGVSREVFLEARGAAYRQYWERNKHTWTQDFGEYSGLVP